MTKHLRYLFALLLFTCWGVTEGWAMENRVNNYGNNLTFLSTSEYVGSKTNYKVGNTTYTNGIVSYTKNRYPTVAFKVPARTKYLHFHIFGSTTGGYYKVVVGGTTILNNQRLYFDASLLDTSASIPTFTTNPGQNYYQRIEFSEPLEENSLVEIISSGSDYKFLVFGVYYEDPDTPHRGTSAGNPFSPAEVRALMNDHVGLSEKVYVKGYVSTDTQLNESSGKATFNISNDGTTNNQVLVNGCLKNLSGATFSHPYQVLPRDKVTIYANINVMSSQCLDNGRLSSQVHPTYKLFLSNNEEISTLDMYDNYGSTNENNWPLHSVLPGPISNLNWFQFIETYSDDPSYEKLLRGPATGGSYYDITWETMDDIPLAEATYTGGLLRLPAGDDYFLTVNQTEGGPTLTVRGFPEPKYTIQTSLGKTAELTLDNETWTFRGEMTMNKCEDFYIIDQTGKMFMAPIEGDYKYVDGNNNTDLPVVEYDDINLTACNYLMQVAGTFTFILSSNAEGKKLTVVPTSGEWPPVTPLYYLRFENEQGGTEYVEFNETEPGIYELPHQVFTGQEVWFLRRLGGNRSNMGHNKPATIYNPYYYFNRYNSKDVALHENEAHLLMGSTKEVTFHITDMNDGSDPLLTITDWPTPVLAFVHNGTQVGTFDYDTETDTYVYQYQAEKDKSIHFIDLVGSQVIYVDGQEGLTLDRSNSTNIPLTGIQTDDIYRPIKMKGEGLFTYKVKFTDNGIYLDVEWPAPDYRIVTSTGENPGEQPGVEFTMNDDGSYTGTFKVDYLNYDSNSNACQFVIRDAGIDYGLPSSFYQENTSLTKANSQNLELTSADDASFLRLVRWGTYTFNISPDFKLSVEWPQPAYKFVVQRQEGDVTKEYKVPFEYDEESGTYTIPQLGIYEGDSFYVTDTISSQGWGYSSSPYINRNNSTNLRLSPNGWIPSVQGVAGLAFFEVTMQEDENSDDLIMNFTGWPEPGYYLYFFSGWYENRDNYLFQEDAQRPGVYTLTADLKDEYVNSSVMFSIANFDGFSPLSFLCPNGDAWEVVLKRDNSTDIPLIDGLMHMFRLPVGTYTFELDTNGDTPKLTVIWPRPSYKIRFVTDQESTDIPFFYDEQEGVYRVTTSTVKDREFWIVDEANTYFGIRYPHNGNTVTESNHNFQLIDVSTDSSDRLIMGASGHFTFVLDDNANGKFLTIDGVWTTNIDDMDNAIYSDKAQGCTGSAGTIAISLKNAQEPIAYQFDLKLPEGVTLKTDDNGDYICRLSDRHDGHTASVNYDQQYGMYHVVVSSMQSKPLSDNDGIILTLGIDVADNVNVGDYSFYIKNPKYSIALGSTVNMSETTNVLTVDNFLLGDVNNDGEVDVSDVVCIVNHKIGKPNLVFVEKAADVDFDGEIDIADAVKLVNYIIRKITVLSHGVTGPVPMLETESLPEPQ